MRRLLVAAAALLLWVSPIAAQNVQETQAPVPLGGNDTRSLPSPNNLPPMFGANLFTHKASFAGSGVIAPGGGAVSISPPAGGSAALGAGILGAATKGPLGSEDLAALAAGAVGQTTQSSRIPGTTVQPPAGIGAFDPGHVMAPGDVVQIHIYGATTLDQQATVDSNGDIFLPTIGPVHVAGTPAGNLQSVVEQAISAIYQSTAQVYVTLASAVPVNVFVTGAVVLPGQYAQPSTASVITFLEAAGGIDPKRGSYRDIEVLRNGRPILHVDLYHFLLNGQLPPLRLQERDTILVRAQGPTVAAKGDVTGVFRYELTRPETGAQLIALARPYPDATRIHLVGIRAGRPAAFDYGLAEFRRVPIQNGDIAEFVPDRPTNVMSVRFEGRFDGPSNLTVSRQATLFDVLPYLKVDPYFADTSAVYVRRLSVAQAQKAAIDDQLQRLKAAVVTSPTITEEQAKQQEAEAKVIFQYAAELSKVTPEGRLIVEHHGQLENVRLEDGDVIVIPSRTDLVLVSGEVRLPQAVVYLSGAPIEHYIAAAGGFTDRAQDDPLLVIRGSGETLSGAHPAISAGDRIIVLPAPSNLTFSLVKDLTTIIYNVAVTAGVALTNIK